MGRTSFICSLLIVARLSSRGRVWTGFGQLRQAADRNNLAGLDRQIASKTGPNLLQDRSHFPGSTESFQTTGITKAPMQTRTKAMQIRPQAEPLAVMGPPAPRP